MTKLFAGFLALSLVCCEVSAFAQGYTNIVLADGPLLYWNFNESGDTDPAVDLVGGDAGDSLLPEGNATRVASAINAGGLLLGRAASFDGSQLTKFFSGSLTPDANPDAWAVEMWVRPQGVDPGSRFEYLLEARGGAVNVPGILYDYGNENTLEVYSQVGRTGADGPILAGDQWQHLVIGYFGAANDRVDFFIDGALADSLAFAPDVPFGTDQIAVGNSVPGHPDFDHFEGQIDELAVYDLTGMTVGDIESKLSALSGHYSAVPEPASALMAVTVLSAFLVRFRRGM